MKFTRTVDTARIFKRDGSINPHTHRAVYHSLGDRRFSIEQSDEHDCWVAYDLGIGIDRVFDRFRDAKNWCKNQAQVA